MDSVCSSLGLTFKTVATDPAVCLKLNPSARLEVSQNGDLGVAYCGPLGSGLQKECAQFPNSCLSCPNCTNSTSPSQTTQLYSKLFVECGPPPISTTQSLRVASPGGSLLTQFSPVPTLGNLALDVPMEISPFGVLDRSSTGAVGRISGSVKTVQNCKVGSCLDFDGTGGNDYVDFGNPPALASISDKMTISAWIYPRGPGEGTIVDKYAWSGFGPLFFYSAGRLALYAYNPKVNFLCPSGPANKCEGNAITLNEWQHVAVTIDANGSVVFFRNGIPQVERRAVNIGNWGTNATLRIGARNKAIQLQPFDGMIDEVKVYREVLSPKLLNVLYSTGSVPVTPVVSTGGKSTSTTGLSLPATGVLPASGTTSAGSSGTGGSGTSGTLVTQLTTIVHNGDVYSLIKGNPPGSAPLPQDTGSKVCALITGSNKKPMICKDPISSTDETTSFPQTNFEVAKKFYGNRVAVNTTLDGGNFEMVFYKNSNKMIPQLEGYTDLTIHTCTQCDKNLTCNQSLSAPSTFADEVIVRCFEDTSAAVASSGSAGGVPAFVKQVAKIVQVPDGSGDIEFTLDVDQYQDPIDIRVSLNTGKGVSDLSILSVSHGSISSKGSPQIVGVDSSFSPLTLLIKAKTSHVFTSETSTAELQIISSSLGKVSVPLISQTFVLDNAAPLNTTISVGNVGVDFAEVKVTASDLSAQRPAHHKIWYGTSKSDVAGRSGNATFFQSSQMNGGIVLKNLKPSTNYYLAQDVVDALGNVSRGLSLLDFNTHSAVSTVSPSSSSSGTSSLTTTTGGTLHGSSLTRTGFISTSASTFDPNLNDSLSIDAHIVVGFQDAGNVVDLDVICSGTALLADNYVHQAQSNIPPLGKVIVTPRSVSLSYRPPNTAPYSVQGRFLFDAALVGSSDCVLELNSPAYGLMTITLPTITVVSSGGSGAGSTTGSVIGSSGSTSGTGSGSGTGSTTGSGAGTGTLPPILALPQPNLSCSFPSCAGNSTIVVTTPATYDPVTGAQLTCDVLSCQPLGGGSGPGIIPGVPSPFIPAPGLPPIMCAIPQFSGNVTCVNGPLNTSPAQFNCPTYICTPNPTTIGVAPPTFVTGTSSSGSSSSTTTSTSSGSTGTGSSVTTGSAPTTTPPQTSPVPPKPCAPGLVTRLPNYLRAQLSTGVDLTQFYQVGPREVYIYDQLGKRISKFDANFCGDLDMDVEGGRDDFLGAAYMHRLQTTQSGGFYDLFAKKNPSDQFLRVCPGKADSPLCPASYSPNALFDSNGQIVQNNGVDLTLLSQMVISVDLQTDEWIANVSGTAVQGVAAGATGPTMVTTSSASPSTSVSSSASSSSTTGTPSSSSTTGSTTSSSGTTGSSSSTSSPTASSSSVTGTTSTTGGSLQSPSSSSTSSGTSGTTGGSPPSSSSTTSSSTTGGSGTGTTSTPSGTSSASTTGSVSTGTNSGSQSFSTLQIDFFGLPQSPAPFSVSSLPVTTGIALPGNGPYIFSGFQSGTYTLTSFLTQGFEFVPGLGYSIIQQPGMSNLQVEFTIPAQVSTFVLNLQVAPVSGSSSGVSSISTGSSSTGTSSSSTGGLSTSTGTTGSGGSTTSGSSSASTGSLLPGNTTSSGGSSSSTGAPTSGSSSTTGSSSTGTGSVFAPSGVTTAGSSSSTGPSPSGSTSTTGASTTGSGSLPSPTITSGSSSTTSSTSGALLTGSTSTGSSSAGTSSASSSSGGSTSTGSGSGTGSAAQGSGSSASLPGAGGSQRYQTYSSEGRRVTQSHQQAAQQFQNLLISEGREGVLSAFDEQTTDQKVDEVVRRLIATRTVLDALLDLSTLSSAEDYQVTNLTQRTLYVLLRSYRIRSNQQTIGQVVGQSYDFDFRESNDVALSRARHVAKSVVLTVGETCFTDDLLMSLQRLDSDGNPFWWFGYWSMFELLGIDLAQLVGIPNFGPDSEVDKVNTLTFMKALVEECGR